MTIAPDPDSDHTRAPVPAPADDAAGRLLAALLATAGLGDPAGELTLSES